jgi:hypothetical protein
VNYNKYDLSIHCPSSLYACSRYSDLFDDDDDVDDCGGGYDEDGDYDYDDDDAIFWLCL